MGAGAQLIAVDKSDGHLLWRHKLDDHPLSIDTASPTIHNGVVYVGVASVEENGIDCGASTNACSFRGSEAAVKLSNRQSHLEDLHDQPPHRPPGTPARPSGARRRRST